MDQKDQNFRYIVRIVNTDLDGNKPIMQALRKIRGISHSIAGAICNNTSIIKTKKAGVLEDAEIKKLDGEIKAIFTRLPEWMLNRRSTVPGESSHLTGSDLDFSREEDIRLMKKIRCYKGIRHSLGLPVRGQHTRSNFRRNKGKGLGVHRKSVGQQAPPAESKSDKKGK